MLIIEIKKGENIETSLITIFFAMRDNQCRKCQNPSFAIVISFHNKGLVFQFPFLNFGMIAEPISNREIAPQYNHIIQINL